MAAWNCVTYSPFAPVLLATANCDSNRAEQTVCGSVGTVLFTALGISFAAIAIHGAFRQPDDLFTDEPEVRVSLLLTSVLYDL